MQGTAPAQPQAPTSGTVANVISGAPLTQTGEDIVMSQPVTAVTPAQPAQPQTPSGPQAPNVITIPGTNVSVQTPAPAQPQLPSPDTATGIESLGTGGAFTPPVVSTATPTGPQVPSMGAPITVDTSGVAVDPNVTGFDIINNEVAETGSLSNDTAQQVAETYGLSMTEVANAAESAMGLDQSQATGEGVVMSQPVEPTTEPTAFDIINNEIAGDGALSNDTAQQVATDFNLSMQDVANIAEGIMGLEASQATGPSTSVSTETVATDVAAPTDGSVEVTIPSDSTTDTEGFTFDGEILGPDTPVSTDVAPESEGITLEGTTATTDVVVPTPPSSPSTPSTPTTVTTETTTPTFVDTVPPDDEEEVVVEVDEPLPPAADPEGPGDGGDTEVEVGTGDDGGDGEEEVVEEAPFECPEGFEAVQINGEWRCQSTEALPERMRPTGGSYYQPRTPSPAASKSAYRFR